MQTGPPTAELATIVSFLEGPTVDQDGTVYFTETRTHRIMKFAPDGALTVYRENSNAANGLVFDTQWRLVACEGNQDNPRVTRTNIKTGRVEVLAGRPMGLKLTAPNDVTFDNQDRLYFTDLPGGTVHRIDTDGKVTMILDRPDIQRPNGLTISPDGKILYLVEANQSEGGARMLRAYDLAADGAVSNMRVFFNFYPGRSADGITIDSAGNVIAAAGLNAPRGTSETLDTQPGIHVISPAGQRIQYIPIPEDTITNCAFGGPDLKTLYVTAGKSLFKIRMDVAGTRR
ncbi:MAG: SMP-30/gluconolactonase/LRE family protein [Acidobacteria bacterium]|nr:SMP-30/gluconolactonase/LRE family protein [Acidobacteriota bacterium]